MKEFQDKVAVITGAASGIGYAIAERCAQEGMKVVPADIEESALKKAEEKLKAAGDDLLVVPMDVSKANDVEALAQKTLDAFGAVHLLVNNAGVAARGTTWDSTLADWEWVMGVNLWGVIHGARIFTPIMLAQDCECHIVNTSSLAGLFPYHTSASYQVTKHAVVALSEQMYYSLKNLGCKVNVSVLCPGWVKTAILNSGRNRPVELQNEASDAPLSPTQQALMQQIATYIEEGMSPEVVAEHVFNAIRDEKFYIITHSEFDSYIQSRMEAILKRLNPLDSGDWTRS
jgi:NAD(P)-dependent dehydrogenase (short-subunit alcohol dehydrogenase family)